MRVIVNEPLLAKRATWGRRIMALGFALLVLAVIMSLNQQTVWGAYVVMLAGLIVMNIGVWIGGKALRTPRADEILDKSLKGLNHGSRLYNYLLPVDHVLLAPPGLYVLTLKFQNGQITARGEEWHRKQGLWATFRALFQPRMGNPGRQARKEVAKVQSWLQRHLPDAEIPVRPLIVFVNPEAKLQIAESAVPAVALADLKGYLRTTLKEKTLPQETLKALTDLCDEQIV